MRAVTGLCVLLGICSLTLDAVPVDDKRAATDRHEIELLMVVDYSAFKQWYDMTAVNETYNDRVSKTKANMLKYLHSLIQSSNIVYKSLESSNLYIQIKLVDVIFTTHAADSPWTETVKVHHTDEYHVDPDKVLPLFQPYSVSLQSSKPHDHAMVFTSYALDHGDGDTFAGYAYTDAECKARSVSIAQDSLGIYTAQLMAHEIGHSLGCDHDGDGNSCSGADGYTMAADFKSLNPKKWIFSSCSVNYMKTYLASLDAKHRDCLLSTNNHNPNPLLTNMAPKLFGQEFSPDEQCRIHYGPGSYLCRERYHGDFSEVCLKMRCYKPSDDSCHWRDGGDGMSCGDGKWCLSNQCVKDSQAPSVLESCPVGDQSGIVMNGMTCKQLMASDPNICHKSDIRYRCCQMCAAGLSAGPAVSLDQQCEFKYGKGSFFCRTAHRYSGVNVSTVLCGHMYCNDPNRDNWCHSTHAEDRTTCGNKMWCQNGVCVHDDSAPTAEDDCIFGDQTIGVAAHRLTCAEVKLPENHYRCYDSYTREKCCATCKSIMTSRSGCEYGDHITGCHASTCSHYSSHHRQNCCQTCSSGPAIG